MPEERNVSRGTPVRLQEIAAHCGLSRMTVSYALRGDRANVSIETIRRVRAAARKLGYDPSTAHAARRLRYQGTGGSVVNHLAAAFFPHTNLHERYWGLILEGLQYGFFENRNGLLSCAVWPEAGEIGGQLPRLFHRGDVDGAVIFPTEQYRENLVAVLRAEPGFGERPVVTLLEALPGCSSVRVDDVQAGYLAARHLLELGHRHLMTFVSPRYTSPIVTNRIAGQRRACEERGLNPAAVLHTTGWLWDTQPGMRVALEQALAEFPRVTGILCPNDGFGVQLAPLLRHMGRRIPEDISLVGVDDSEGLPDAVGENMWTTVRLPLRELGRTAAELLLARVSGASANDEERVLPAELVVRGSTCPPAMSLTTDGKAGPRM